MQEDFERQHHLDRMYLIEHYLQIEEEWQEYEEYLNKQPAKIEIISPKILNNEIINRNREF